MDLQNVLGAFISARHTGHRSTKRRANTRVRAGTYSRLLDLLEDRVLLSGNLAITGFALLDSGGQPVSSVSAGQKIFIQAKFSTVNLPANASYHVSYMVNGFTLQTGSLTFGAGVSSAENWLANWGSFYVTPGTNQLTITVDPDHSVAETSFTDNAKPFTFSAAAQAVAPVSYTVAQIRDAYGINNIANFGTASADGTGQTIALIDGANMPTLFSDLDNFDKLMSATTTSTQTLFDQYGPASSFVTVYNQFGVDITSHMTTSGTNGVPAMDTTGHWEGEETLDVQWSHAIAPGARLVVIEVNDDANVFTNLLNANALAASLPGVTSVSNSWGRDEFNGEIAYDTSAFVTPAGHTGVTFLTASNDNGAFVYSSNGPTSPQFSYYPATSPNVISVGGTQLTLNGDAYGSETSWSFPPPDNTFNFSNAAKAGTWQSTAGGFNGNYGVAAAGGSNTATWTIPITPTNTGFGTEITTSWIANAGNTTNATYKIYSGSASGTLLGTVTVDQTKAPAGTLAGGRQFQELGVFFPTLDGNKNGTITVVLSSTGSGNIAADAIGAAEGWASSGGPTPFYSEPAYQNAFQNTGHRTTPDVSLISSETNGVTTYLTPFDSQLNAGTPGPNYGGFGTSLACPCWAGIIAIVNQGRVAAGGTTLNTTANPQQALQAIYSLPSSDFHDITTGYNGFFAGTGYDMVTGRGTPISNLMVPALVQFGLPVVPTHVALAQQPSGSVAGQTLTSAGAITPSLVVNVLDAHGAIDTNDSSNVTITLTAINGATLGGTTTVQAINGVATFANLAIGKAGTGYTLSITDGALTSAKSGAFAVTPDVASSQLSIVQQPIHTLVGKPLIPTLVLKAADRFGNVITTDHSKIILTTNAGTFTGANTVTLANGAATFANIIFKVAGTYTLTAAPATTSTLAITTPIVFNETIDKASTIMPTPVVKPAGYIYGTPISLAETLTSNVPTKTLPFNSTASKPTLVIAGTDNIAAISFTAAGAAKFTVPVLDVGTYLCQIVYPGDTNHSANNSTTFNLIINKASTTTTLVASPAALVFGQALTLTATVKGIKVPPGVARTGNVEFLDNGQVFHTMALNASSNASYTFTPTATGSHSYSAIYLSSTDFNGSSSAVKKLTVNKDKIALHITAPTPSTSIPHNQTFDLAVQMSVLAPGADALAGDLVTIKDNGKAIGTITLDGAGAGSLLGLSYTASGVHSLSAIFLGNVNDLAATSSVVRVISN